MIYKIFDKKWKSGSVTRARSKTPPTHAKQKKNNVQINPLYQTNNWLKNCTSHLSENL